MAAAPLRHSSNQLFFFFPVLLERLQESFSSRSHSFICKLAPVECSRLNGEGWRGGGEGTGTAANWTEKQGWWDWSQGNKSSCRLCRCVIFFFFFLFVFKLIWINGSGRWNSANLCFALHRNSALRRASGKGGITTSILTRFRLVTT